MATHHEIETRTARSLLLGAVEELAPIIYDDLKELGYQLPLRTKGDARHLIERLSDITAREHLAKSFIPMARNRWELKLASHLTDIALQQYDLLTAYSTAAYTDSIHPIDRWRGWERAQSQVLWAGYMAVMPEIGIDIAEYLLE